MENGRGLSVFLEHGGLEILSRARGRVEREYFSLEQLSGGRGNISVGVLVSG